MHLEKCPRDQSLGVLRIFSVCKTAFQNMVYGAPFHKTHPDIESGRKRRRGFEAALKIMVQL
jgi:hypothetical protein